MNVLFVTTYYPNPKIGGIERVTKIISEDFAKNGIECHNIYLYPDGADSSVAHMACTLVPSMYDNEFVCNYIRNNNIRIVINQSNPFYTPFLRQVCDATGAKLITCLHNSTECKAQPYGEAVNTASGIKKGLIAAGYPLFALYSGSKLKGTHRMSYRLSDLTVMLSKSLIEPYKRVLNLKDNGRKLTYINNPLSFSMDITSEELRAKRKTALVVSRLYESQKKLSLLFRCWAEVEKHVSDWQLVVVGDGPDRSRYESLVAEFGLRSVTFAGSQSSMPYYRDASLFCMTSVWEGFPMTILESLQMGVVPVVMDSFPAVRDLVDNGGNGIIVPYGDSEVYAKALLGLMQDNETLNEMRKSAVRSARRFRMENIRAGWMEVLNRVMK